jgi:RimJ/RimL family protein N-acetyltransferase
MSVHPGTPPDPNDEDDLTPVVPLQVGPYRLDAPAMSDLPAIRAAFADPEIARWNPGAVTEGEAADEFVREWIVGRSTWSSQHASWVIREVDGSVIGQVSLHHLDLDGRTGEVGYWLAPAGRGRGIGAAAVAATTTYGFDALGLLRLSLFHARENDASCRLAQRCGYAHEGTLRQSYVYGDGLRHDEHLHARLSTDPAPDLPPLPGRA